jgi:hypothetical protein
MEYEPKTQKRQGGAVAVRTHGGPAPRPERIPVLIVASADGWLEIYGPENVSVVFRNRLAVGLPEGASLCDEYISLSLPKPHRDLYETTRPKLCDQVRKIRPSDEAARLLNVELVQAAIELGRLPQAVPA